MFVLAVVPAMFVAASIGEEIEDKTITYLWSRPLPRWHVIAGKLVALAPIAIGSRSLAGSSRCRSAPDALAPSTLVGIAAAALAISILASGISTLAPKHGMALTIIYMLLFDVPIGEIRRRCRSSRHAPGAPDRGHRRAWRARERRSSHARDHDGGARECVARDRVVEDPPDRSLTAEAAELLPRREQIELAVGEPLDEITGERRDLRHVRVSSLSAVSQVS